LSPRTSYGTALAEFYLIAIVIFITIALIVTRAGSALRSDRMTPHTAGKRTMATTAGRMGSAGDDDGRRVRHIVSRVRSTASC
jgi:hypothetical protein